MPVVALLGYFGFGNQGDEAILAGTLDLLRSRAPSFRPLVLSQDPSVTHEIHSVEAAPRSSLFSIVKSLGPEDRFMLSGGGLLQDRTSLRSLLYYLWALRQAGRRAATVHWAVGVGPLSPLGRTFVGLFGAPTYSVLRDEGSSRALIGAGYPQARVTTGADAAFTLKGTRPEPIGGTIGYAPRSFPGTDALTFGRELIQEAGKIGKSVVLLPFRETEDGPLCRDLRDHSGGIATIRDLPKDPRSIPGALKDLEGLVAVRLHALVLGSLAGVPLAALPYDPKVLIHARLLDVPVLSSGDARRVVAGEALGDGMRSKERAEILGQVAKQAFDTMWEALS